MKKPEIILEVIKEESGYSASAKVGDKFIATYGDSFDELKTNIIEAVNLAFDEENISYKIEEIKYSYDLKSFFSFYKVLNVKALSERIGMNQSLLAQYISGKKKPSAKQANRILLGVQRIGKELSEISFLI